MAYEVVRSVDVDRDLGLIFDHLIESYTALGEPLSDALDRAADRVRRIEDHLQLLGKLPHQGTLMPNVSPNLRHVTKERAVFYFEIDDTQQLIRVLAIFFGGQDHQRHMLGRLVGKS